MLEFQVQGMSCGHCVKAVTQAVQSVQPEARVEIDLEAGRVRIDGAGDAARIVLSRIYPSFAASADNDGCAAIGLVEALTHADALPMARRFDLTEAQARAYASVDKLDFPSGFCRRDIGWREVAREAE